MVKKLPTTNGMLDEVSGTLMGHRDGHGFLIRDDGEPDIFLSPNEMRAAMHKDRVRVRGMRFDRKGRVEGRIVEILDRPRLPLIGRLLNEGGAWLLAPEDKRYGQDVLIPRTAIGAAEAGQVVVVELTEPPSMHAQPVGRVIEVLGDADDAGMEIEIAVRKYGIPHEFSEACLAQAMALPDGVSASDHAGRVDLRDVPLVTIDGEDARDFDDAVYCEPYKAGRGKAAVSGWRLLVVIADVSAYVQNGAAIDVDAYDRATSVYFPRRVIPMLPEKLSNGLCSLNPDVDRLCMVCDMVVTRGGDIHAYQFYPAVMHSHARFTYTEVAAILLNTQGPEAKAHAARVDDLIHLQDVYRALLQSRHARGAVDFETTETQIVSDENGRIQRIVPRVRTEAHRLIEEAMLAANVCSADFVLRAQQPALFRVHEGPTPEKRNQLQAYLKALGIGVTLSDEPTTAELAQVAAMTKDRPDAQQVHTMLLRSMQQAIYTPINSGHFGLAYDAYTHFTSPIRRYPDLLVHRVIKAVLAGQSYTLPALPQPGEAHAKLSQRLEKNKRERSRHAEVHGERMHKPDAFPGQLKERQAWEAAGLHCSANERRADEASRDVEAWLKCCYMREHLGEEFAGTVGTVTSFGLFVTLDAMHVEGLIHITELGGDYWRFDEVRQELRGERTGMRYAAGMKVWVQVSRVDLDARKIDFRLIQDGGVGSKRVGVPPGVGASKGAADKASAQAAAKAPGKASGRKRPGVDAERQTKARQAKARSAAQKSAIKRKGRP